MTFWGFRQCFKNYVDDIFLNEVNENCRKFLWEIQKYARILFFLSFSAFDFKVLSNKKTNTQNLLKSNLRVVKLNFRLQNANILSTEPFRLFSLLISQRKFFEKSFFKATWHQKPLKTTKHNFKRLFWSIAGAFELSKTFCSL